MASDAASQSAESRVDASQPAQEGPQLGSSQPLSADPELLRKAEIGRAARLLIERGLPMPLREANWARRHPGLPAPASGVPSPPNQSRALNSHSTLCAGIRCSRAAERDPWRKRPPSPPSLVRVAPHEGRHRMAVLVSRPLVPVTPGATRRSGPTGCVLRSFCNSCGYRWGGLPQASLCYMGWESWRLRTARRHMQSSRSCRCRPGTHPGASRP